MTTQGTIRNILRELSETHHSSDCTPLEFPQLQSEFAQQLQLGQARHAAETAYALASLYRVTDVHDRRDWATAGVWARRCIALLQSLPSRTLNEVASERTSVGGVLLPELFHA